MTELDRLGLAVTIDLGLFALYCEAWQCFSDADAKVDAAGLYFETDKGYIGIHPAELAKRDAVSRITKLGDRLGVGINSRRGLDLDGMLKTEGNGDPLVAYGKKK